VDETANLPPLRDVVKEMRSFGLEAELSTTPTSQGAQNVPAPMATRERPRVFARLDPVGGETSAKEGAVWHETTRPRIKLCRDVRDQRSRRGWSMKHEVRVQARAAAAY